MSALLRALAVSLALVIAAASAAAGQQGYLAPIATAVAVPPGWSLTPSLGLSQTYDDNVTLQGTTNTVGEFVNVVSPAGSPNDERLRGHQGTDYYCSFLLEV